jgi:hypothetical protein
MENIWTQGRGSSRLPRRIFGFRMDEVPGDWVTHENKMSGHENAILIKTQIPSLNFSWIYSILN